MKKCLLGAVIGVTLAFACNLSCAEDSYPLEPIIVTASRSSDVEDGRLQGDVRKLSASATVIDRKAIEASGARNIPDLLKTELGVTVSEYSGNGKTAKVDIRGFGESSLSNMLVMIDGRRANQIDLSGADFLQIDIGSIERIEILRGPQSVLYGDNAVGGVVNIVTRRGAGMKPSIGLSYEIGSYRHTSEGVTATGGTAFLDYFISAGVRHDGGVRGNNELESGDFNQTMTMKPTQDLHIRLDSGYHKDWYGMPGALTDKQIERDGARATDNPDNKSKSEDMHFSPGIDLNGDTPIGRVNFITDFLFRAQRTAMLTDQAMYWYEGNTHTRSFGATPRIVIESSIKDATNRLLVGIDYYYHRFEKLSGVWSGGKDAILINEATLGIYSTDTLYLTPRLTLNAGGRMEWADNRFDQQEIEKSDNNKRLSESAFDVGINYSYNDKSAVFVTAARTFRFPAVDEWYQALWVGGGGGGLNLNLRPQTGMNYEVGVRDNSLEWLKGQMSIYILDLKHELFYNPISFDNEVYDHTMRQGFESEVHMLAFKDLDLWGKYTYEKAYFVGSHFAGNEIPMVPRHKASVGMDYTFMDCVRIHCAMNGVGERRFISDQRNLLRRMKHYITSDARVAYYKHGFEIFLAVRNIFDYEYSEIGAYGQYYPANGRTVTTGVRYTF